jgi:hypothetical protein
MIRKTIAEAKSIDPRLISVIYPGGSKPKPFNLKDKSFHYTIEFKV